ncbi:MAG: acetyl-CoA carboxylase biotin carboxyl carrier protein subunit [Lentimicrobiaceae bacterium]
MEEINKSQELKTIIIDNVKYKTRLTKKYLERVPYVSSNPHNIISHIPGTVVKVTVKEGDIVKKGSKLLEVDAMKMISSIYSPMEGKVLKIHIKDGDLVPKGRLLIELE